MGDIEHAIVQGKAWSRLAAFIGVMGVVLVWIYLQDHTPRIKVDRTTATVLEVKQAGWHVKLTSGEALWLYASPGIWPKRGAVLPVLIETYESGNRRVLFDRDRWMTGG